MNNEVTVNEAAHEKGVSKAAITRAIREGRLPARADIIPGRARAIWRIKVADLAAWTPATPEEKGRRGGGARKRE